MRVIASTRSLVSEAKAAQPACDRGYFLSQGKSLRSLPGLPLQSARYHTLARTEALYEKILRRRDLPQVFIEKKDVFNDLRRVITAIREAQSLEEYEEVKKGIACLPEINERMEEINRSPISCSSQIAQLALAKQTQERSF